MNGVSATGWRDLPAVPRKAVVRAEGWPPSVRLAVIALALFAVTVPFPNNILVPSALRIALYNTRPWVAVLVALAPLLAMAFAGSDRLARVATDPRLRRLALMGFAFPIWYTIVSVTRGAFSVPVIGLYWLWALVSFVLAPALVRSAAELRALLYVLGAVALVQFALAVLLSATGDVQAAYPTMQRSGPIPAIGENVPLGFINANYYAQIPQIVFTVLAFHRGVLGRGRPLVTGAGLAVAATLVVLAWSRDVLVYLAALWLCMGLLRGGRAKRALLAILAFLGVLAVTLLVLESRFEELDRFSTGRLQFWAYLWDQVFSGEGAGYAFTFGVGDVPAWPNIPTFDPLAGAKEFTKLHVDNFYLELLFEGGAVGAVLFLLPYGDLAARAFAQLGAPGQERRLAAWTLGILVGLGFQGIVISTFPTFGSPLGLFFALVAVAPVAAAAPPERREP